MRFDEIMHQLGADRYQLTAAQLEQIETQGWIALPVFSPDEVAVFRDAAERMVADMKLSPNTSDGGFRLQDLIGHAAFDLAWSHPKLLAVARAWLKDEFKPMSLNYRSPLPGGGLQDLHSDQTATPYCQAIIALCDVTEENGAPRVVPGTHRSKRLPRDDMEDLYAPHPRQIQMTGPAGTALFFDGNLWHSGARNHSSAQRPVLHSGFMLRHADSVAMEQQRGIISPQTYNRLSRAQRNFLDFRVVNPDYATKAVPTGAGLVPLAVA
jgi:hypothetical protein